MPTDDRFREFVERLAEDLDASPARAEQLAAEAYLSRYHFERVIAASAGETPTKMRARLLLERAAYQMITSDVPLLEIALGAGYASHEAFTRAFRRAYGLTPSRWRRHPTRYQLHAPSRVHFHPPAGLRMPGRQRMGSMDLLVRMVEHHVWVVEQLLDRAGHLTDEQLDDPLGATLDGIDGESLRWALSRLIGQMQMWNAAMDDSEYDFAAEQHESLSSMRSRFAGVGKRFVEQVRDAAADERFDETFVEAFSEPPVVMTYGAMVAHVLTFAAHHRLLALAKLREFGVTDLGWADPKHWLMASLGS